MKHAELIIDALAGRIGELEQVEAGLRAELNAIVAEAAPLREALADEPENEPCRRLLPAAAECVRRLRAERDRERSRFHENGHVQTSVPRAIPVERDRTVIDDDGEP